MPDRGLTIREPSRFLKWPNLPGSASTVPPAPGLVPDSGAGNRVRLANSIIALVLLVDRQQERGRHRLEPQAFHLLDPPRDAQVPDPNPAGQFFKI